MEHNDNTIKRQFVTVEKVAQEYVRRRLRLQGDYRSNTSSNVERFTTLTNTINDLELDLEDYLDWCSIWFPDMYLNRIASVKIANKFISEGKRNPVREGIINEICFMYDRLNEGLVFDGNLSRLLLEPVFEFDPVFILAVAVRYGLDDIISNDSIVKSAKSQCWLRPEWYTQLGVYLPFNFSELSQKDVIPWNLL